MNTKHFDYLVSQLETRIPVYLIDFETDGILKKASSIMLNDNRVVIGNGPTTGLMLNQIIDLIREYKPTEAPLFGAVTPKVCVEFDHKVFALEPCNMRLEFNNRDHFLLFDITHAEQLESEQT